MSRDALGRIAYAGMFEVEVEGTEGVALCVDTDEIQELSDAVAAAGFVGLQLDFTHRCDVYDAAPRDERLAFNKGVLAGWLAELQEGKESGQGE
jgi:hypothetical protein